MYSGTGERVNSSHEREVAARDVEYCFMLQAVEVLLGF